MIVLLQEVKTKPFCKAIDPETIAGKNTLTAVVVDV